ncbi:MAG: carbohydrate binding family 9 domain-containing protein [Gemmatimonadota bacterium]|nr:MAG: carbohydrate binding family 9 domain-containing protein [Gemmatimonadota bacterium]
MLELAAHTPSRSVIVGAVLLGLMTTAPSVVAQKSSATRGTDSPTPAVAFALRAERGSPRVDGKLDDPVWQNAVVITGFTQIDPNDGAQPSERTEVRVTYDDHALYVGARLYDSDPGSVAGRLGRRDSFTPSDAFWIDIDSYHDHRTSFQFGVNAAGARWDGVATNDNGHADLSWDPVWSVTTAIDSLGWTAEMKIPFSQLRFSSQREQVWGVNFSRDIVRKNERVRWSWKPKEETGYASRFGHLNGLQDIPQPRRLEVLPYALAQSDFLEGADPLNPFNDGSVQKWSGGLDLKYGLTSDLTLDGTVNPDFGQVEADPAVVNLSAFETYFSERRPFFVEGANLFEFGAGSGGFVFGAPQLFYSRRIGRAPSLPASEPGGYAHNPNATSILGAAKLSGKTAGWSVGLLSAFTAREYAKVQLSDGTRQSRLVEPSANYTVLSLRRDFRNGGTGVGAMATGVHRDLSDPQFNFLTSSAYSGGTDFFHRFWRNQWALNGSFSTSHIRGDRAAITAAQFSSARYYQRPDQHYVSIDTNATSMTGYAGSLQFGKVAGNWIYGTDFYAYSPGFEVNDAGFETQVDRIFSGVRVQRRWLNPGKVFRTFRINATFAQSWNFGGVNLYRSLYAGLGGQFLNYWNFSVGASYNPKGSNDKGTRGGPLIERPQSWDVQAFFGSDYRKPLSIVAFGYYARNMYDGWGAGSGIDITFRPASAIELTFSPTYDKTHSIGMYVTQRRDPTAVATYGGRYLFSELLQSSLDATVRLDVALTPDLSIQWYIQPFIAAGDYVRFKELAEPETYNFLRYGVDGGSTIDFDRDSNSYTVDPDGPDGPAEPITFDNPDFRVRSLRSNLVMRWEYIPGSTVFVVWNHGRSGYENDPTFGFFDQIRGVFRDNMANSFLIKLNYWLSL